MSALQIPAGWGYAPAGAAPKLRPAAQPRAKRPPRAWWRLSEREEAMAREVIAFGCAAVVRGVNVRDRFGVRWVTACRVARYCRACVAGQLPPGAANLLRESNAGPTTTVISTAPKGEEVGHG